MFFITIVDSNLITIGNQIAGKLASHMTETNDINPLNRRLYCLPQRLSHPYIAIAKNAPPAIFRFFNR
jgi:hypothetical protein